jgi:hypothetical protein
VLDGRRDSASTDGKPEQGSPESPRRSNGGPVKSNDLIRIAGRKASRFRWLYKTRLVKGWPKGSTLTAVRFVALDPDINTFTYELGNVREVCEEVADILGRDRASALRYGSELLSDGVLRARIRRRSGFRLEAKSRPPLGRHVAAYVATRLTKPSLVVECGIKHGLGSAVLLRALERNGEEGRQGQLLSIDPDSQAGWVVDRSAHPDWQLVVATSGEALPSALGSRSVGMLISDSLPDESVVAWELNAALRSGARETVVMSNHHWNDVVRTIAAERGARVGMVFEHPNGHPYPGRGIDVAYFSDN